MAAKKKSGGSEADRRELVIITGLSGSGKGTVLRVLEDLGFYSVDNLPIELLPKFAELTSVSPNIRRAALVVDIREGQALKRFPQLYKSLRRELRTTLLFLEAADEMLVRRYSETRRPHPLGRNATVPQSIETERNALAAIRALADHTIDTSNFTVHELKDAVKSMFAGSHLDQRIMIQVTSFGFRNGIPTDSDLVFDVRFLPNPNYIPEFKPLTGRHPGVARYVRSFPQTQEFIERISDLLQYLLPHYIREGKSYLTISFGCTGGQHRSVMMAGEFRKRLAKAGYRVKETHRDMPR
ncbi:MAG TPA: RNase adapter RapZ [Bryobacteraceae bacterium]|nr:RNase adapter RapZ [Bryobacteraceae bacterium]